MSGRSTSTDSGSLAAFNVERQRRGRRQSTRRQPTSQPPRLGRALTATSRRSRPWRRGAAG
eukprot:597085-Pyramimonas_sp.AAC.1